MQKPKIIGRLEGDGWVATVDERGGWDCEDLDILILLQTKFNPHLYEAVGVGGPFAFGIYTLGNAAAATKARRVWHHLSGYFYERES